MSGIPISVGLLGGSGRMGKATAALLHGEWRDRANLVAAPGRAADLSPLLGLDAVIDFSSPEGTLAFARLALARGSSERLPVLVTGTTGWKLDDRKVLEVLAKRTPVLLSSNFSTGALAMTEVLRTAAPLLERLGYTPVIVETHHRHKKDAPSGTAISLQRAIASEGPGNVQTHSIRVGEVVGDHEVTFHGPSDRITFSHSARDRAIFARGAIEAAHWLVTSRRPPGALMGMDTYFRERFKGA